MTSTLNENKNEKIKTLNIKLETKIEMFKFIEITVS